MIWKVYLVQKMKKVINVGGNKEGRFEIKKLRLKSLNYDVIDEEVLNENKGKIDIRFNIGSTKIVIIEE
ncbi:hypothetical protein SAMN05421781_0517 [Marinococcus luteus]|uniref:Uncharacterized protein n=1 Tax=Marinococcus luteus TaxID=1122204 RepID=A0A1H2R0H6_9BACI|nr:hypothetical protein SAMN05421781_0517 [Marinococcus luteus]